MRNASIWVAVALAAAGGCGGSEQVSQNGDKAVTAGDPPASAGKVAAGRPAAPTRPADPAAPAPSCADLGGAVSAAAAAAGACQRSAECQSIEVAGACAVDGVGCRAFVSSAQPREPFEQALAAFAAGGCASECKCDATPVRAACVAERCAAEPPIVAPPDDRIAKRITMQNVEKNLWIPFGGTYFRLWGTAFTGSQPKGVSVSPDGSKVFVTNTGFHDHKNVSRFDPATLKIVVESDFPGNAIESLVAPEGDVIWASNFYHKEVVELDTEKLKVKRRFKVQNVAKHFALSPDGTKLWISNWASDTTSVVDRASGEAEAHIAVGQQPRGTAITHDGKKVYVTNFGGKSVSVIDAVERKVVKTIATPCKAPRHAAVTADDRILVSCYGDTSVLVIDSKTDEIVKRVTVGNGPKTIAVAHDQRFAYTADYRGATMSIIDLATWDVLILPIPTVKTSGLFVDHDDRRIYATGWSSRNLMVFERLMPGDTPGTDLGPQGFGAVCRQSPKSDCLKYP
jgi:YVTN family beta-propeller protein